MKVHLIDGTYELFRAFYGAPKASGMDGSEVGATRGLLSSLAALLHSPQVTHAAVAFDHVIESFRNTLFPGYKTGAGIEPALLDQFELAEQAVHALGVVVWPMIEFEADDALASAAARFANDPAVEQVVLCTPDKDLAQCVQGTRIVCWDRLRAKVYDQQGVFAKFGISPASIPDYLALVGDSADGIPGIAGWGSKSASAILAEYEHLERIPADPARWSVKVRSAARLAAQLQAGAADAQLYRKLATLRTDVFLAETLPELQYRGPRWQELERMAAHLGEMRLLERLASWRQ